jgi:hypothetical protein
VQGGGPLAGFLPLGEHLLLRPDQIVAWRGNDPAVAADVRAELLSRDYSREFSRDRAR